MIERYRAFFTPSPTDIGPLVGRLIFSGHPDVDFLVDLTNTGELDTYVPRKINPVQTILVSEADVTLYGPVADSGLNGELHIDTTVEPPIVYFCEYSDNINKA